MITRQGGLNQMPAYKSCPTNNQQLHRFLWQTYNAHGIASKVILKRLRRTSGGKAGKKVLLAQSQPAAMLVQPEPLIHIPLYCWRNAPDYAMRGMVQQLLACLQSYFAHENTYALLVTTNDRRPFEIVSAYKNKTGYGFQLQLVTQEELLSVFDTDLYRLYDVRSIRMIFSKFYPVLKREAEAIVHVDFDTIFAAKIDVAPLLVSDIGLVDANQFIDAKFRWRPTQHQIDFFRLPQTVTPSWNWINSGVFSVQRRGFEIIAGEVRHYLENLDRAIDEGIDVFTDEMIMNALALRERDSVALIPDYRLHFLAYLLKYDPAWTMSARIIHFHSLKPDRFWYRDGVLTHRDGLNEVQLSRINEDLYLAVLMWYRHLHAACRGLPYLFPLLEAIPPDVVEREIEARCGRACGGTRSCA